MRPTRIPLALAASALSTILALGGCADTDQPPGPSDQDTAAATGGAATPDMAAAPHTTPPAGIALPGLFAIMTGLQADAEQISRGLWASDFDAIAAGARAIADHPTVPPDELVRVRDALGEDIARFKALDTRVHDLAVRLEREALDTDTGAVLATDAELRAGCVQCHTRFRDRLRADIR